jgi:hypothetical protein
MVNKPRRYSGTVRIYSETKELILKLIEDEAIKTSDGLPINKLADMVEFAMFRLTNQRIATESEKQLMSEYGFLTIEQLDQYNKTLELIPKEMRPNIRKLLRQVIVDGTVDKYLATITPSQISVPEDF